MSWEDFVPAIQFALNTSYSSKINNTPFEELYGYKPKLPTIPGTVTAPSSFATERLLIYQKAKELLAQQQKDEEVKIGTEAVKDFKIGQNIYFSEKSFGVTNWSGPFPVIAIQPHRLQINLGTKTRWVPASRVISEEEHLNEGRTRDQETSPTSRRSQRIQNRSADQGMQTIHQIAAAQAINVLQAAEEQLKQTQEAAQSLIRAHQDQATALQLISEYQQADPSPLEARINLINPADYLPRPYLNEIAQKIYSSPLPAFETTTPEELSYWRSFEPTTRNTIITGDPLGIPEYRPALCTVVEAPTNPAEEDEPPLDEAPEPEAGTAPAPATRNETPSITDSGTGSDTKSGTTRTTATSSSKPKKTLDQKVKKLGKTMLSRISPARMSARFTTKGKENRVPPGPDSPSFSYSS